MGVREVWGEMGGKECVGMGWVGKSVGMRWV